MKRKYLWVYITLFLVLVGANTLLATHEIANNQLDNEDKMQTDSGQKDQLNRTPPTNRSVAMVGDVISVNSIEGTELHFTVLSFNVSTHTGTVEIGKLENGIYADGNGIEGQVNGGTLTIPSIINKDAIEFSVVSIGESALSKCEIGTLALPNTITEIKKNALSENSFITLTIPEGVTSIGPNAFYKNLELKVVKLPTSIDYLGGDLFQDSTKLKTVHFPVQNAQVHPQNDVIKAPFIQISVNKGILIVPTQDACEKWRNDTVIITDSVIKSQGIVTREIDLQFYDKKLIPLDLTGVKKLWGKDIRYSKKADDQWTIDTKCLDLPSFPSVEDLEYKANFWGINEIAISTVNNLGVVKQSKVNGASGFNNYYFVIDGKMIALEEELNTVVEGVNREYDGTAKGIKVSFNRTLDKDYFLKDVRYATIKIYSITQGTAGSKAFKFNEFPAELGSTYSEEMLHAKFKNVADSGSYGYTVQLSDKEITNQNTWWSNLVVGKNTVEVSITAADISITPQVTQEIDWNNQAVLPPITLSSGDTPGTIVWDEGQAPERGSKKYHYTFTPDHLYADGIAGTGIANFTKTEENGSVTITYKGDAIPLPTATPTQLPPDKPAITPTSTPKIKPNVSPSERPVVIPTNTPSLVPTSTSTTVEVNSKVSLENTEAGLKVESVGRTDVFEKGEKVYLTEAAESVKKEVELNLNNIIKVFDIFIERDGVKVEKNYDSKIRITFEAKEYMQYSELKIYQKSKDNKYNKLSFEIVKEKIVFECDALDTYILTGIKNEFPWWIIGLTTLGLVMVVTMILYRKSK